MQSGEQIVQSIKFKILWDDGTWDVGTNGQIILYDIYFDYTINQSAGDPYIFFTEPDQRLLDLKRIGQTDLNLEAKLSEKMKLQLKLWR